MKNDTTFGQCNCEHNLQPVYFQEKEYNNGVFTGRSRRAVSHLFCEKCQKQVIVDDSFDGPWE